jgi:hypothetical protein
METGVVVPGMTEKTDDPLHDTEPSGEVPDTVAL